jgi:(E)-4-hydroxy-3-methylbut-2-enyl-diphosphate synthase
MYCKDLSQYTRRKSDRIKVGVVSMGGDLPIVIQTMTCTPTNNIEATVNQIIRSVDAGASIVRITVPSMKDVENSKAIKTLLRSRGYQTPLVADIHFNQKIAFEAAKIFEKVRINPGNFADNKKPAQSDLSHQEYADELERIKLEFIPLLTICKEFDTALRIGTNHGSLSDRIMSKYGDTPEGMVESAMEFLRICKEEDFRNVVISMKSSNTLVMVQAMRLLVDKMDAENMSYPFHLGVTEAGEGEDGRIKSSVGIGCLLADGIGDTIRVSLTEDPEFEIPVAQKLVDNLKNRGSHSFIEPVTKYSFDPSSFVRRQTSLCENVGGNQVPIVIASINCIDNPKDLLPDYFTISNLDDAQDAKLNIC